MLHSKMMCRMCVYIVVDERGGNRMNERKWMIRRGEGGRGENFKSNQVQGHLYQNEPRANKFNR